MLPATPENRESQPHRARLTDVALHVADEREFDRARDIAHLRSGYLLGQLVEAGLAQVQEETVRVVSSVQLLEVPLVQLVCRIVWYVGHEASQDGDRVTIEHGRQTEDATPTGQFVPQMLLHLRRVLLRLRVFLVCDGQFQRLDGPMAGRRGGGRRDQGPPVFADRHVVPEIVRQDGLLQVLPYLEREDVPEKRMSRAKVLQKQTQSVRMSIVTGENQRKLV